MKGFFKVILVATPLFAVVFFYVINKQSLLDTQIERESAKFDRAWNEWESQSITTPDPMIHQKRAAAAESRLVELREREVKEQQQLDQMQNELDAAMKEQAQGSP